MGSGEPRLPEAVRHALTHRRAGVRSYEASEDLANWIAQAEWDMELERRSWSFDLSRQVADAEWGDVGAVQPFLDGRALVIHRARGDRALVLHPLRNSGAAGPASDEPAR